MPRLSKLLATVLLIGALTQAGVAQGGVPPAAPDTSALGWARRLLVAMNAEQALRQGLDSGFSAQRRQGNAGVPAVFWDSLTARVHSVVPGLLDSLAGVYAGALSVADLKSLVQFYDSPLGKRYAAAQMVFQARSSEMAKRWGMRVALDVMRDLVDKGLITDMPH